MVNLQNGDIFSSLKWENESIPHLFGEKVSVISTHLSLAAFSSSFWCNFKVRESQEIETLNCSFSEGKHVCRISSLK